MDFRCCVCERRYYSASKALEGARCEAEGCAGHLVSASTRILKTVPAERP